MEGGWKDDRKGEESENGRKKGLQERRCEGKKEGREKEGLRKKER